MNEPTLKPHVVFPHPDVLQSAIAARRPDLLSSFKRSDARRALRRARWSSKMVWSHSSVSPLIELFDASPEYLAEVVRRWDRSVFIADTKTNINPVLVWRDGARERQVASPFNVAGWVRFITAGDGAVDAHCNDVESGVYLGLPRTRSESFATDREVMVPRMPLLALAAFHLDISSAQSDRLVELFELYTSMLYSNDSSQNVYEALRRDVVEAFTELCTSSHGVVDDVPLWMMFSCITCASRYELVELMSSGVDPVRAAYLWFMGFDFSAISRILVFDLDLDMAIALFTPRAGMMFFDLAVQPMKVFVSGMAFD